MPSLSVAFFNEAIGVLSQETHLNTLTTCAALQILSMSSGSWGLPVEALKYLRESVNIGKRMGLFGIHSEAESANTWLADNQDWRRAASYTAWGVFNWVLYVSSCNTQRNAIFANINGTSAYMERISIPQSLTYRLCSLFRVRH
jgi:hypothetical protein